MIRILFWLASAVVLVSAGPQQEPREAQVTVLSQEESDAMVHSFHGRQTSGGGLGWLRQNSVSEAFSVLFPVSGMNPLICKTSQDDLFTLGICLRVTDCLYYVGESYGSCGGGLGSCCVFEKKCDQTTNMFISHFVNPSFSTIDRGTGECKLTVSPMNSNICQYRIDFDSFEVLGPNKHSKCVDDFFGVTGGSPVPKLCGSLTGQHVFVNVKPGGGPIVLTTDTSNVRTMARKWNMKITQIGCNAPDRAPAGCLQFYNETSGSVRSFNYRRTNNLEADGHRQLQNMNYGICINSKVGYCDVTWTQGGKTDNSFTVTGDATAVDANDKSVRVSKKGTNECKTDFITIPGGKYENPETKEVQAAERFCGTKLPEVKTSAQPYTLHVVTDANEDDDVTNQGFEINFRQNLCHT